MKSRPMLPPEKYRAWFDRDAHGTWFANRSADIAAKIRDWITGRGKNIICAMTPTDRRFLRNWSTSLRISWRCITKLVFWSGFSVEYWLGPRPATTNLAPWRKHKPKQKTAASAEAPQGTKLKVTIDGAIVYAKKILIENCSAGDLAEEKTPAEAPAAAPAYNFFAGC